MSKTRAYEPYVIAEVALRRSDDNDATTISTARTATCNGRSLRIVSRSRNSADDDGDGASTAGLRLSTSSVSDIPSDPAIVALRAETGFPSFVDEIAFC